jgi:hypothetical protein
MVHDVDIATDILYHVMNKDVGAAEEDEEDMQMLGDEDQNKIQEGEVEQDEEERRAERRCL